MRCDAQLLEAVHRTELKNVGVKENSPNRLAETTVIHRIFGGYLRSQARAAGRVVM